MEGEIPTQRRGVHRLCTVKDELEDADVSLNYQTRRRLAITFNLNISISIGAINKILSYH